MIKKFLEFVYHWSSKLNVWSWQKLYGSKEKGYGYRK